MMEKAIIIDDEKHCVDGLQRLLNQYCPEIQIAGSCSNGKEGLELIAKEQPSLIFLDVEMPGMTGFEMLGTLSSFPFDIIFTTAFDQYAIRAIRFGALDYLVKPIDKDELLETINKFLNRTQRDSLKQLSALLTHIRKNNDLSFQKIALPTLHGYELVPLNNIIFCESSSNYTDIHLNNGQHMLISRTLKDIEDLLDMQPFFR